MAITPAARKAKGRRLQQWVCEQINKLTGLPWGKDQPIESRPMGQSGVDVRLETRALEQFPFSVECKFCETWAVPAWVEQAKKNQLPGTDWLLIVKRSRRSPVAILDAEAFFRLVKQAYRKGKSRDQE